MKHCPRRVAGAKVDTICLRSLAGLYELVESNQFDAVGRSLSNCSCRGVLATPSYSVHGIVSGYDGSEWGELIGVSASPARFRFQALLRLSTPTAGVHVSLTHARTWALFGPTRSLRSFGAPMLPRTIHWSRTVLGGSMLFTVGWRKSFRR